MNRIFRILPLLLLASLVCLGFGWLMMLPDDFENLSQSIVATNFFGNNILSAITTKNYWDVVNEYKPLMHTWYVGLLMQFYITIPFLMFAIGHFIKNEENRKKVTFVLLVLIGIVSLTMYLVENSAAAKFYYLPYRLYEFCAGGLMFCLFGKKPESVNNNIWVNMGFVMIYLSLIALLFVDAEYASGSVKLLLTVILTSVLMVMMPRVKLAQGKIFSNKWVAIVGTASFSIFVWHQIVLAFIRYSFTSNLTEILPLFIFVMITIVLSIASYKYIEQMEKSKSAWITILFLLVMTTSISLYIYKEAGVVRDVPELEVIEGKVHRGMWAEYCDRGYQYDKEFTDSKKPKWYVIGNSFGRDMVNIILESDISEDIEVSYADMEHYKEYTKRFEIADVVILSTLGLNQELIEDIKQRCLDNSRFIIIGEKNFGENNGQIYRHRFESDYHQMTIHMQEGYEEKNKILKNIYSDYYIDMIELVSTSDGKVRVFSDDGCFISQDCRHLTKAGAQYYAKLIDWSRFFMNNN